MRGCLLMCFASFLSLGQLAAVPKAVIFDFGGVLTQSPDRTVLEDFLCKTLNLTKEEYESQREKKSKAIKEGKTDDEFWRRFAAEKGILVTEEFTEGFYQAFRKAVGVRKEMYELVDQLKKQNIIVGMLSNIDERLAQMIRKINLYEPFDPCLLSYEMGVEKPDPKVFQMLIDQLGLVAKDIVFIDDKQENIDQAKKIGIDAILFTSPEQVQKELSKR